MSGWPARQRMHSLVASPLNSAAETTWRRARLPRPRRPDRWAGTRVQRRRSIWTGRLATGPLPEAKRLVESLLLSSRRRRLGWRYVWASRLL